MEVEVSTSSSQLSSQRYFIGHNPEPFQFSSHLEFLSLIVILSFCIGFSSLVMYLGLHEFCNKRNIREYFSLVIIIGGETFRKMFILEI
jgi:hypothetical protein